MSKYGGFKEAFEKFMAEPGPAELIYFPPLDVCACKPVSDPLRPKKENGLYSGFEVLVSKGVV